MFFFTSHIFLGTDITWHGEVCNNRDFLVQFYSITWVGYITWVTNYRVHDPIHKRSISSLAKCDTV